MKKRILIALVVLLALSLVTVAVVLANTVGSSTMIFEGALAAANGGYTGTIPMTAGEYYVPGGPGENIYTGGGFDVYAKEGGTAYVQGMTPDTYVIGSDHDAYSQAGPWGWWYDPDVADWDKYSLELTADHWYLRYTPTGESPMSGALIWLGAGTGYAAETDLGTQNGGHDGSAAHGGGAQAWDWDCGWGVEVVPLELPGFLVQVTDLGGGNYKVTLTPADPTEWHVWEGYSIQDAIDAASDGDIIYVHEGTYNENITINKSLILQAASSPVIDGGASGDAISVSANGVTIDGFEIRNGYNGIAGQTSNSTFSNNTIHHNLNIPGYAGIGILLWGDNDNNSILANTIYDNDRQGIFIGYSDTSKMSTGNLISGNTIYNNGLYTNANGPDPSAFGIQLWSADNNTIEGNEIYGHDDWFPSPGFDFAQGIYLCGAYDNTLRGNNLHGNNYGVGVWSCGRTPIGTTTVQFNCIHGNTGYGVRTFDSTVGATYNWWGDIYGPSGKGPGSFGDAVSTNVLFDPWLGDPSAEAEWRNHGHYVRYWAKMISPLVEAGLVSDECATCIMEPIAESDVGKPSH